MQSSKCGCQLWKVGGMYGCGEQEVGVGGIYGWVWLMGVIVRRYIDFLILLIPTPLVYIWVFLQQHPYFLFIFLMFFVLVIYTLYSIKYIIASEASFLVRSTVVPCQFIYNYILY